MFLEMPVAHKKHLPVLVVDDDLSFLSIVTASLAKAGWRYEVATGGQPAIARLVTGKFSVVLLDLTLPDLNGIDVLRTIRRFPDPPPVVVVTGSTSTRHALEAGKYGAIEFLEKPIKIANLMAVLAGTVDRCCSESGQFVTTERVGPAPVVAPQVLRLAQIVIRGSLSPTDFKNCRGLAKASNVTHGTIRRWCQMAAVPGRPFTRFARGFWAVRQALILQCPPSQLLDAADPKSIASILSPRTPQGTTVSAYCATQSHLPPHSEVVVGCLRLTN